MDLRSIALDILFISGVSVVTYALALIYVPVAFLFAGIVLCMVSLMLVRR